MTVRGPVEMLLARVAERWPSVRVDGSQLATALAHREMPADHAHAVDVALALAIAAGDAGAIAMFDREIVASVRAALKRYGDDDFVEEILQRTRVKLLVREHEQVPLLGYRGSGPLVAFVQIVAIREALVALRATKRETSSDEALVNLAFTEPVLASTRELYKRQLGTAFRAAMNELAPRERNLLRMCFLDGLSSDEIARFYSVHRVTAFRWLRDAREHLLSRTRALFLEALNIGETEAESLMQSLAASLSVVW